MIHHVLKVPPEESRIFADDGVVGERSRRDRVAFLLLDPKLKAYVGSIRRIVDLRRLEDVKLNVSPAVNDPILAERLAAIKEVERADGQGKLVGRVSPEVILACVGADNIDDRSGLADTVDLMQERHKVLL